MFGASGRRDHCTARGAGAVNRVTDQDGRTSCTTYGARSQEILRDRTSHCMINSSTRGVAGGGGGVGGGIRSNPSTFAQRRSGKRS